MKCGSQGQRGRDALWQSAGRRQPSTRQGEGPGTDSPSRPRKEPALPTPSYQTFSLPSWETIHFCCLSPQDVVLGYDSLWAGTRGLWSGLSLQSRVALGNTTCGHCSFLGGSGWHGLQRADGRKAGRASAWPPPPHPPAARSPAGATHGHSGPCLSDGPGTTSNSWEGLSKAT